MNLHLHNDANVQKKGSRQMSNAPPSCVDFSAMLPVGFFKALADPNRIAILTSLATGARPQTVSEVAERLPINISVVSRHLKILERAQILASERRGKAVLYHVRVAEIVAWLRGLADALDACCPAGVYTLEDDSETPTTNPQPHPEATP